MATPEFKKISVTRGGKPKTTELGRGAPDIIRDEDKQYNHELTTHEVTIKVVTLVGDLGTHVRLWVGIFVKIDINRRKTDYRTLSTFHHCEPKHGSPNEDKCKGWVDIAGDTGLSTEDETHNNRNGEDQETRRVEVLEIHACLLWGDNIITLPGSRHRISSNVGHLDSCFCLW